jgi:hypothetical protein
LYCTKACYRNMAAADSDASTISNTCMDTLAVQEVEGQWTSDAHYPGFGLNEDDDLSRSFPFFLKL